jgi:SAM-dependent methyltransferase
MNQKTDNDARETVREGYAQIAKSGQWSGVTSANAQDPGCCGGAASSGGGCCGPVSLTADDVATAVGYASEDLGMLPEGANMGLSCGNPTAIASLREGEVVVDLGSGGGFDCFLAGPKVGASGRVIGVDMTSEMLDVARGNIASYTKQSGLENVEFRLGEIEHLPVADGTVDVVISNCVVNLSPDKPQVFDEAFRVLRPGGRLAISDVVLTAAVPHDVRADPDSVASCVAGAATVDRLETMLTDTGFGSVNISPNDDSEAFIGDWDDDYDVSEFLVSAVITARKPEDRR